MADDAVEVASAPAEEVDAGPIEPPATPPPAAPPPVPAAVLAGMLDPLSRVGTPSRERKELWELLNLPEVRRLLCASACGCVGVWACGWGGFEVLTRSHWHLGRQGQEFAGGWHKLLEATRSSKTIKSAMEQAREQEGVLLDMLQTCLESIAENTYFVSTAKKTFLAHEQQLSEIPRLRAEMASLQARCEASEANAAAALAAAGKEAPPPPAPAPAPSVPVPTSEPGVSAATDERIRALEATLAAQSVQLRTALQHIEIDNAADEQIHQYFTTAGTSTVMSLDDRRPKTGDSRPASVAEHAVPPVHTADEHAKVAEKLKGTVHTLSMERLAVHTDSHLTRASPASTVPVPVAEPPGGDDGNQAATASESTTGAAAAEAPSSQPVVHAPAMHADQTVVQAMSEDKVDRKLKERLRVELLAVDVQELAEELQARSRAMDAQMAAVHSQLMAGLQTPPPTPPQTPGGEHLQAPAGVASADFEKSRADMAKLEEHRQAAKAALEAHDRSIKALEDENARLLEEISTIKAKDTEQDGLIEKLGDDFDRLNQLTSTLETGLAATKDELGAVAQTAQGAMKSGEEANRRLDQLDAKGLGPPTGGGVMAELEERMERAEIELKRLSGQMNVQEAMDDQARKLAELFAKKAGKDELAAGLHRVDGLEKSIRSEMEGRSAEIAGLIGQAKSEFEEGIQEVGVKVEKKADMDWLNDFEASIREQMKKLQGEAGDKVSAEQMEARLAALRKMLEQAMAGMNDSKGSALAFRCLACDRPLPPKDQWKSKQRTGPAQSIRNGAPVDGPPSGTLNPYPPFAGSVDSFGLEDSSDNIVLRGGFPMSASLGSPGSSPSSHNRTSGVRSSGIRSGIRSVRMTIMPPRYCLSCLIPPRGSCPVAHWPWCNEC